MVKIILKIKTMTSSIIITILSFIITVFIILFLIKTIINNQILEIRNYLISTSKLLKTEVHKNQRLTINSNLHTMKKVVIICIAILLTVLTTLAAFVVFDSRNYFKEVFEAKRQKLNLRNEASVDSLQTVIATQKQKIDSIFVAYEHSQKQIETLSQSQNESKKLIESLQTTIKNQSKSFSDITKAIDTK